MRLLGTSEGFTYVAVLMIVMIMGIMLGATGQCWRQIMKREREEELLFRGMQIKQAIEQWYKISPGPGQSGGAPLNDLNDLIHDPRTPAKIRYLRRLYKDPITGNDFEVLRQPGKGIIGVFSPSQDEPVKKGNFPAGLETFEGQDQYKKWQFVAGQQQTTIATRNPS